MANVSARLLLTTVLCVCMVIDESTAAVANRQEVYFVGDTKSQRVDIDSLQLETVATPLTRETIMALADKDGDGKLTYGEALSYLSFMTPNQIKAGIIELAAVDTDQDGFITLEEIDSKPTDILV